MPIRPSKGVKGTYIELPPALVEQMRELARGNGRSFREEAEHAFVRHLAAPPTIRVEAEVPALDATPAATKPSRGRRPRKPRPPAEEPAPPPPAEPPGEKRKGRKKGE